ncbi:MAG: hypothetical protein U0835_13095 [Isosphaeraceae bacterium]
MMRRVAVMGLALLIALAAGAAVWRFRPGGGGRLDAAVRDYEQGDYASAAEAAKARLVVAPGDPEATRLLARASARLGRDDSALSLFGRLEPTNLTADDYAEIGRALAHKGQADVAAESWNLALRADPDHPGALAALVAYNRGKDRLLAAAGLAERLASPSGAKNKPAWTFRGLVALAEIRAELGDPSAAAAALATRDDRPRRSDGRARRGEGRRLAGRSPTTP